MDMNWTSIFLLSYSHEFFIFFLYLGRWHFFNCPFFDQFWRDLRDKIRKSILSIFQEKVTSVLRIFIVPLLIDRYLQSVKCLNLLYSVFVVQWQIVSNFNILKRNINVQVKLPLIFRQLFSIFSVAPVIRVSNQILGAPLGTNVRLECHVESFPNSVNYWSNTKGEIILQGWVPNFIHNIVLNCKRYMLRIYDA